MATSESQNPGVEIERLTRAFEAFTSATSTLEQAYLALQDRAAALRIELEEKNQLLQESLERLQTTLYVPDKDAPHLPSPA